MAPRTCAAVTANSAITLAQLLVGNVMYCNVGAARPQMSSMFSTPSSSCRPTPRQPASQRPSQVSPLPLHQLLENKQEKQKPHSRSPSSRPVALKPAVPALPSAKHKREQAAFNSKLLTAQVDKLQQQANARVARIAQLQTQVHREAAAAGGAFSEGQIWLYFSAFSPSAHNSLYARDYSEGLEALPAAA